MRQPPQSSSCLRANEIVSGNLRGDIVETGSHLARDGFGCNPVQNYKLKPSTNG
jgi:hypothetical protein